MQPNRPWLLIWKNRCCCNVFIYLKKWSLEQDLNLWPLAFKAKYSFEPHQLMLRLKTEPPWDWNPGVACGNKCSWFNLKYLMLFFQCLLLTWMWECENLLMVLVLVWLSGLSWIILSNISPLLNRVDAFVFVAATKGVLLNGEHPFEIK